MCPFPLIFLGGQTRHGTAQGTPLYASINQSRHDLKDVIVVVAHMAVDCGHNAKGLDLSQGMLGDDPNATETPIVVFLVLR